MKKLPQIDTNRLCLTSFTPNDVEQVYAYTSNPNVARYTSWHPHETVADSAAWIDSALSHQDLEPESLDCPWAIRKRDGSLIGCIAFKRTSITIARIDYVLSESEWKQGLMTEAALAVLSWAFANVDGIQEIESGGLTENVASINLLRKCGMTLRKIEKHRFAKFGDIDKEVSYLSITRAEWNTK
jgi:ribosomal-protein-alanine N-acetyltransferase